MDVIRQKSEYIGLHPREYSARNADPTLFDPDTLYKYLPTPFLADLLDLLVTGGKRFILVSSRWEMVFGLVERKIKVHASVYTLRIS